MSDLFANTIQFKEFTLRYGDLTVVNNLNLEIKQGERLCILGPSGEGKTSLLNAITGVISFTQNAAISGVLKINGFRNGDQPVISYVFQDLALFPHLSTQENIAFPLRIQKVSAIEIKERVEGMLHLLHMYDKRNAPIHTLSGGQKQRVALGRALIIEPDILCMDEPLKGLDPNLKMTFLNKLLDIHEKKQFTLVYVTHDWNEATFCANRICILDNGHVQQIGTPEQIYQAPNNLMVATFSGEINTLIINSIDAPAIFEHLVNINNQTIIGFRPEKAIVELRKNENDKIHIFDKKLIIPGIVKFTRFAGSSYNNYISAGDSEIISEGVPLEPGNKVSIHININDIHTF